MSPYEFRQLAQDLVRQDAINRQRPDLQWPSPLRPYVCPPKRHSLDLSRPATWQLQASPVSQIPMKEHPPKNPATPKTAWLIEKDWEDGHPNYLWFEDTRPDWDWHWDANKAAMFATEESALSYLRITLLDDIPHIRVAEHSWPQGF